MDGAGDAVKMGTNVYLASVIVQIFEHVHNITNLQTPIAEALPVSSVDGRVAGTTLRAVDEKTVHLVVLGVQQDRSTVSAYIVNCVRASDENGWCMYYIFDAPGFYYSQCSL
jgi:hypothetical protein